MPVEVPDLYGKVCHCCGDRKGAHGENDSRSSANTLVEGGSGFESLRKADIMRRCGLVLGLMCLCMFLLGTGVAHGQSDAELLEFVNHCTTTYTVLTDDVGLASNAAANIVAHRDGPDATCGTGDDDPFDTVEELDGVPYVGSTAIEALRAYAAGWQNPDAVPALRGWSGVVLAVTLVVLGSVALWPYGRRRQIAPAETHLV